MQKKTRKNKYSVLYQMHKGFSIYVCLRFYGKLQQQQKKYTTIIFSYRKKKLKKKFRKKIRKIISKITAID
jgi:hypothetical protein